MKTYALKIFIAIVLVLCGFGFVLLQNPIPDIDAVYKEYFEKYQLRESAKKELMTELKLLINDVYYEKELGNDYAGLIKTLDYYAKFKEQEPSFEEEIESLNNLSNNELQATAFSSKNSDLCSEFKNFVQNQKSLAEEYHLPYVLPQSSLQLINMEEFLLVKEHLHDAKKAEYSNEKKSTIADKINQLKTFNWKSGNILLAHKKLAHGTLQGYYNHAGIYSKKCDCIIDAIPANENFSGGVRESDWDYWAENFTDFVILKFDELPQAKREQIESYVLTKLHEPYSISTYKKNEKSGWYCSKLVYLAYLQAGIDLDTKRGISILPDDIALNQNFDKSVCMEFTE